VKRLIAPLGRIVKCNGPPIVTRPPQTSTLLGAGGVGWVWELALQHGCALSLKTDGDPSRGLIKAAWAGLSAAEDGEAASAAQAHCPSDRRPRKCSSYMEKV